MAPVEGSNPGRVRLWEIRTPAGFDFEPRWGSNFPTCRALESSTVFPYEWPRLKHRTLAGFDYGESNPSGVRFRTPMGFDFLGIEPRWGWISNPTGVRCGLKSNPVGVRFGP